MSIDFDLIEMGMDFLNPSIEMSMRFYYDSGFDSYFLKQNLLKKQLSSN